MSRAGRNFGKVSYLWVLAMHPVFGILPENQVTLIFAQFKTQKQDRKKGNLILCKLKPWLLHNNVSWN